MRDPRSTRTTSARRWATALVQRVGDAVQAELCDPDREWDLAPAVCALPPAGVRVCSFEDAAPRTAPVFRCPAAARSVIADGHAALVATAAAREARSRGSAKWPSCSFEKSKKHLKRPLSA